jgi:hypothetical protein
MRAPGRGFAFPGALSFVVCAWVLLGCADEPPLERPRDTTVPESAVTSLPADSLLLDLNVPPEVRAGEPLLVTMRVRNPASRAVDLALHGRSPTLDVIITRPNGDTVWHRLAGEVLPAILSLRTLAPGEQLEMSTRWDQRTPQGPAAPGEYVVRGLLLTDGAPLATGPARFRILAR